MKSAGIAAILAVLIPGLGHIYLGKITEGIVYLVLGVIILGMGGAVAVFLGVATGGVGYLIGLGIIAVLYLAFWAWQIYDAYNKSNQYNASIQQTGRAPW